MEERLRELLKLALKNKVSDIHITSFEDETIIEFRLNNGLLQVPKDERDHRLLKYLQYLSNMDVSNMIEPETGQFELEINDEKVSFRFALMQSKFIRNGVIRLLTYHHNMCIDELSFKMDINAYFKKIQNNDNGLYLFSGPTSSGKTTTLYTILNEINNKKIYTIEDPIEVYYKKFFQLEVNLKKHLDYAEGIKQLLRHDPDIIMIGEIRDENAASMALRASLTGHLVLSTIHASSCVNTLYRMKELNVDLNLLKQTIKGIVNQRLIYSPKYKKKVVIYEIMDEETLAYYFKNERLPDNYQTIDKEIAWAKEYQIIK